MVGRLVAMEVAIVVTIDGRAEARARASWLDWMGSLRSPLSELRNVVARVEARLLGGSVRRCGIMVVSLQLRSRVVTPYCCITCRLYIHENVHLE